MNLVNIFFSPQKYFLVLKEKPIWLPPLIIVLVCALIQTFVATRYFQFEEIAERMRERGAPEEQIERVKRFYESPKAIILSLTSVVFTTLLFTFLFSLILNLALPLLGTEGVFLKTFSLVIGASLVSALGSLLRALLIFIKKSPFVATNLSLLLPGAKKGFLFSLLAQLDIFTIWKIILLGLGLTIIYDLKGKKGYYLSFGLWLLWVLVAAFLFRSSPR